MAKNIEEKALDSDAAKWERFVDDPNCKHIDCFDYESYKEKRRVVISAKRLPMHGEIWRVVALAHSGGHTFKLSITPDEAFRLSRIFRRAAEIALEAEYQKKI